MPDGVQEVDVGHLAKLVRLELTPGERTLFSSQLSSIIAFARQVQSVDTTGIPPESDSVDAGVRERPDIETACLSADDALANAPDRSAAGTWFRVPKVIGS
jgi:aspartyl-tRNA(Asn)/glutamyl-tRNA(Gln) amidotransferase subunit C